MKIAIQEGTVREYRMRVYHCINTNLLSDMQG